MEAEAVHAAGADMKSVRQCKSGVSHGVRCGRLHLPTLPISRSAPARTLLEERTSRQLEEAALDGRPREILSTDCA